MTQKRLHYYLNIVALAVALLAGLIGLLAVEHSQPHTVTVLHTAFALAVTAHILRVKGY
jgi:hypothetical protein